MHLPNRAHQFHTQFVALLPAAYIYFQWTPSPPPAAEGGYPYGGAPVANTWEPACFSCQTCGPTPSCVVAPFLMCFVDRRFGMKSKQAALPERHFVVTRRASVTLPAAGWLGGGVDDGPFLLLSRPVGSALFWRNSSIIHSPANQTQRSKRSGFCDSIGLKLAWSALPYPRLGVAGRPLCSCAGYMRRRVHPFTVVGGQHVRQPLRGWLRIIPSPE
jgi:hypothetical protein